MRTALFVGACGGLLLGAAAGYFAWASTAWWVGLIYLSAGVFVLVVNWIVLPRQGKVKVSRKR